MAESADRLRAPVPAGRALVFPFASSNLSSTTGGEVDDLSLQTASVLVRCVSTRCSSMSPSNLVITRGSRRASYDTRSVHTSTPGTPATCRLAHQCERECRIRDPRDETGASASREAALRVRQLAQSGECARRLQVTSDVVDRTCKGGRRRDRNSSLCSSWCARSSPGTCCDAPTCATAQGYRTRTAVGNYQIA